MLWDFSEWPEYRGGHISGVLIEGVQCTCIMICLGMGGGGGGGGGSGGGRPITSSCNSDRCEQGGSLEGAGPHQIRMSDKCVKPAAVRPDLQLWCM